MKKRKQKNILNKNQWIILIPLILVMILDLTFTIIGQPEYYWNNHSYFDEANPIGKILLSTGPLYFIAVFIIYLIGVLFIIIKIHRPWNIMVYLGFFISHAWAGASWTSEILSRYFLMNINEFYSGIIYFIIIAIISGFCFNTINKTNT